MMSLTRFCPKPGVRRLFAGALSLAAAGLLAGCGSLFGSSAPKPAPLPTLPAQPVQLQLLWRDDLPSRRSPSQAVLAGDRYVVAGGDGRLAAYALADGRVLWRAHVRQELGAALGSDGLVAAVVSLDNELIVVREDRELWRTRLGSRVVTAPLVAGERVFVLTVDRQVLAFDALNGRALWTQQRAGAGEPLTLLKPGVLRAHRNLLVVGLGPRLVALDSLDGSVRWDLPLAAPRGTNEVERLADLVGPAGREGKVICARAFQSALGCVDADAGRLLWSKPGSGEEGTAVDAEQVYSVDANDRLMAWKRSGGEVRWSSESLLRRQLTAPVVVGRHLLVGDAQGYVHVFDRDSGQPVGRIATDGSAVDSPLSVAPGGTVLLSTRRGGVFALRLPR